MTGSRTHLVGKPLDKNGDQQVEQDVVAESHEGDEIKGGPMGRPLHPRKKHDVPIFLGEHLKSREMVGRSSGFLSPGKP